ncbi:MAG: RNA polymerase sigma factor, partial [Gemmatimonadales bacterium]
MNDSDAALVQRVLAGDVEAYGPLMARYRDRLGRFALHMLGDRADAEEAVQEAFVRGFRSLRTCEQPERFGAWLFRILANRCRTARARRRRSRETFSPFEPDWETAGGRAPDDGAAGREEIERALAQLPADQR